MFKRHAIQVLREAGHKQAEVAKQLGDSERSVRTIESEPVVASIHDAGERRRRRIGRPSKAEPFRDLIVATLKEEPELMSLELLRRARLKGYAGGKSAFLRAGLFTAPAGYATGRPVRRAAGRVQRP